MFTLYQFPISQHCRRVTSLLVEVGIDYQAELVDLATDQHLSEQYLAINPNHQVPSLVDGEVVIHESNAILRYLCTKYELSDWYPTDLQQRANVEQWLDWIQCQQSPAIVGIVFHSLFAGDQADKQAITTGFYQLKALNPMIEQALTDNAFLTGDQPTIADLALVSNLCHLAFVDAMPSSSNIQRWMSQMLKLKGVKASLPEPLAYLSG